MSYVYDITITFSYSTDVGSPINTLATLTKNTAQGVTASNISTVVASLISNVASGAVIESIVVSKRAVIS